MEYGNVIKYIGKGFIGFKKKKPYMIFVKEESLNSVRVIYLGNEMIVSPHEIIKHVKEKVNIQCG